MVEELMRLDNTIGKITLHFKNLLFGVVGPSKAEYKKIESEIAALKRYREFVAYE